MAYASRPVETLADTHGLVTRPGTRIWGSSEGRGWGSVFATTQREAPFEADCAPVADHLIVVHLSGPVRVTRTLTGKRESRLVPPGGTFIMPGDVAFGVRLEGMLDTVHFYLHRALFNEVADEFGAGVRGARVIPRLGRPDPLLEQIAIGLRDELREGTPSSALFVDQLARVAATRLIRAHSTASPNPAEDALRPGLSRSQRQRVLDYIAANLEGDPTYWSSRRSRASAPCISRGSSAQALAWHRTTISCGPGSSGQEVCCRRATRQSRQSHSTADLAIRST